MKRDLMEILACPVCKGSLKLTAEEEDERRLLRVLFIATIARQPIL